MPSRAKPPGPPPNELSVPAQRVVDSVQHHQKRIAQTHGARVARQSEALTQAGRAIADAASAGQVLPQLSAYALDALQRYALTLDVLRQRASNDQAHEAAGTPPVLNYEHELVVDGRTLARPVNYQLLRILPPKVSGCSTGSGPT